MAKLPSGRFELASFSFCAFNRVLLNDMKCDSKELNQGFSLQRFLSQDNDQIVLFSKKASSKKISLSKSRSNSSSQTSVKIKHEIKQESVDSQFYKDNDESAKLEQFESNIFANKVEADVKNVEIKMESQDLVMPLVYQEDNAFKTESKQFELISIEGNSQINTSIADVQKMGVTEQTDADAYNCPVCDKDLTYTKSSYLRQKHVEECLSLNEKPPEETLEYDSCVFCGKYLKHFNADRRQLHLNRCLDSLGEAEKGEKTYKAGETYAGQPVPFLKDLEICPVCHEFAPFVNRQVKQKIVHIKQCSKRSNVSLPELLKKFQWIGWGHLPIASEEVPAPPCEPSPAINTPKHEIVAYVRDEEVDDFKTDSDFNQTIHIHKKRKVETSGRNDDKHDEELQTVLALSRSMKDVESLTRRKERIRPSDERDWNAANIISIEESRLKAIAKLDELLFPTANTHAIQLERERSIGTLGPSRIPSVSLFYWHLASNTDSNWNNPGVFVTPFIRDLSNSKGK